MTSFVVFDPGIDFNTSYSIRIRQKMYIISSILWLLRFIWFNYWNRSTCISNKWYTWNVREAMMTENSRWWHQSTKSVYESMLIERTLMDYSSQDAKAVEEFLPFLVSQNSWRYVAFKMEMYTRKECGIKWNQKLYYFNTINICSMVFHTIRWRF